MNLFTFLLLFPALLFNSEIESPKTTHTLLEENTLRTVVLIRHAKSSHENPEWLDIERPLGPRGYNDAPFMGEKLKEKGINFDLIIASPSQRTTETIHLICKEIGYPVDNIIWDSSVYLSSSENLINIIRELDNGINTVGIVGHNPSMTEMANSLQKNEKIENVPTTGIVSVSFAIENWADLKLKKGKLNYFIYPKKYKKKEQ